MLGVERSEDPLKEESCDVLLVNRGTDVAELEGSAFPPAELNRADDLTLVCQSSALSFLAGFGFVVSRVDVLE